LVQKLLVEFGKMPNDIWEPKHFIAFNWRLFPQVLGVKEQACHYNGLLEPGNTSSSQTVRGFVFHFHVHEFKGMAVLGELIKLSWCRQAVLCHRTVIQVKVRGGRGGILT
jgi:hypothetical protein